MKLRVYVDNSLVGGCDDEEFRDHSKRLMACFARGNFILVRSSLTLQELAAAPERVRLHLAAVPEEHIEVLSLTAAASELAQAYIDQGYRESPPHPRLQLRKSPHGLPYAREQGAPGGTAR